jgi:L-fucose/D-arabinose isomerase
MRGVGIAGFSHGRDFVHQRLVSFIVGVEERIPAACQGFGTEVVRGTEPITSDEGAVRDARRLAARRPDLTIFTYPVWALPHFSVHAARAAAGPRVLFSNMGPTYPGGRSLVATRGSPDQTGRGPERLWGEVEDPGRPAAPNRGCLAGHAVSGPTTSTPRPATSPLSCRLYTACWTSASSDSTPALREVNN